LKRIGFFHGGRNLFHKVVVAKNHFQRGRTSKKPPASRQRHVCSVTLSNLTQRSRRRRMHNRRLKLFFHADLLVVRAPAAVEDARLLAQPGVSET